MLDDWRSLGFDVAFSRAINGGRAQGWFDRYDILVPGTDVVWGTVTSSRRSGSIETDYSVAVRDVGGSACTDANIHHNLARCIAAAEIVLGGLDPSQLGGLTEELCAADSSLCASGAAIHDPTTEFFVIDLPVGIAVGALTKAAVSAISGRFTTAPTSALANSGPIPQSLGAASRAEGLARKLNLNINSPTTRQVLNSLDTDVSSFVSQYRKGSIWRELPGEVADMTVAEAIQHSSTARKLLTSNRFAK